MAQRTIALPTDIDIDQTLRSVTVHARVRRPHGDQRPVWAAYTPDGPVTLAFDRSQDSVDVEAWGDAADRGLEMAARLLGIDDDPATFDPPPGMVRDLHRRNPGLRFGRTGLVYDALLPTILGQRVTTIEAKRGYAAIALRYGVSAPGPFELKLAPPASTIAPLSYADFHPLGVERSRAEVLIESARRISRLEEITAMGRDAALARLMAIRGIGPWTANIVLGIVAGDADAVPVGDYHIPNTVSWALAGEPRGTDERMLELLEPYAPHRRRVIALLKFGGVSAPKYGPKTAPRSIANQ